MLRALLLLLIIGVVVYAVVWLFLRSRDGGNGGSARRRSAPLPPDDDPAFLAGIDKRLAEERRQRERAERLKGEEGATPDVPDEDTGAEPSDGNGTDSGSDADASPDDPRP